MNKFLTKIIGASLAIAMMIGVGAGMNAAKVAKTVDADGEPSVVYTLSGSVSGSGNSYAGSNTSTQGGIGWTVNGNLQQNPWRIGGKSISNTKRAIYSTTALPYDVCKIDISFGSADSITVNSLNVGVYSTAQKAATGGTGDVANFTPTFVASDTVTVQKADETSWNNCFYNITLNVTVSDTKNKFVEFNSAQFYAIQTVNPEVDYFDIQFDSQGGSNCDPIEHVADGSTILELPSPTKAKNTSTQTKYTFEGWYTDTSFDENKRFTTSTPVTENLTLYAHYTETHYNVVRFFTNGGSAVDNQEVDNGSRASQPNTSKDGYMLEGWYTNESLEEEFRFNFNTAINNQNLDLYAKWTSITIAENGVFVKVTSTGELVNGGKYLITYNDQKAFNGFLNDLDSTPNTVDVVKDGNYIVKDNNTNKAYFVIDTVNGYIKSSSGQYISQTSYGNGIVTSTTPSEDYQNTFSFSNGNVVITRTINAQTVTLRYNSASNQLKFRYFKSGQQDIQLYKFVKTYTVSFETNGGTEIDDMVVLDGQTLTLPANPTKVADAQNTYEFEGWYTDSNFATPFVPSNPITGNLTLFAKFTVTPVSNPRTYLDSADFNAKLWANTNTQIQSGTDSITFSDEGYSNGQAIESFNVGSVAATTASNGGTAPAYYNTGSAFRLYGKNSLTLTSSTNITKVEFTDADGNRVSNCSVSTGELNGAVWTGSATSITFTNSNNNGHYRISTIEVTYGKPVTSVASAGLRFALSIPTAIWTAIEENWDIEDYGFMLFKTDSLQGLSQTPVKDRYDTNGTESLTPVRKGSGEAPTYIVDNNYVFSVKITATTYAKYFCAAPFFVIDGQYYFLSELQESVKHLAQGGSDTISPAALAILVA